MAEELRTVLLDNGLLIRFIDLTNRYYGDFHRLCIQVSVELPKDLDLPQGLSREELKYERVLEKMGVATAALAAERANLINAYLATSRTYLEKPEFPQQLRQKVQLAKKRPIFLR